MEEIARIIGNGYFQRRRDAMDDLSRNWINDPIINAIACLRLTPERVLEIGCSSGWRLDRIREKYACKCNGIDPSSVAIAEGSAVYPEITLVEGVAEELPYSDGRFDCVIFGHCLYACPRENLFKISYHADRVLKDAGYMIVYDFYPSVPHYNMNIDFNPSYTYKMDYSTMFSWHPHYKIVHRNILIEQNTIASDKVSVVVFKKSGGI